MKTFAYLTIFAALVLITGCRASYSDDDRTAPPELEAFHMVDSYGVSTDEDPFTQLRLSPYMDSGLFEVFWYVNNEEDYTVEMSINDQPSLAGRIVVAEDYCGPGLECDLDGIQFCEYNPDFSISCDPPSEDFPGRTLTYFDELIDLSRPLPQTLYFILDICDTRSDICEFQILDVSME
jgi:hypothetical protein